MQPTVLTSPMSERALLHWLTVVLSLLGAALLYWASAWGVGVSPDSAEYIAAARRLQGPADLFNLPTQWAPGYPVLLALSYLLPADIPTVTRLLQCLVLALNLGLITIILRRVLPAAGAWVLLGIPLLAFSARFFQIHFYAWSEGPLLSAQLGSLLLLLHWREQPSLRLLLWAAAVAALGLLFRYAGIAWVGTLALMLLLSSDGTLAQRWRVALIFGGVAVAPFVVWLLANHVARDETTNRQFVVHLVQAADWQALLQLFAGWFGTGQGVAFQLAQLALTGGVVALGVQGYRAFPPTLRWLLSVCGAFIPLYTAFIVFSKSFLDAYIPFDDRIFIPAYTSFIVLVLACAVRLITLPEVRGRGLSGLLLLFTLAGGALPWWNFATTARLQGVGYWSAAMKRLPSVTEVPQLQGKLVYSNAPDYLRMETDLTIRDYPRKFMPTTQLANPTYEQDMATMLQRVRAGEAFLVHYRTFEWRSYFPAASELTALGFAPIMGAETVFVLSAPAAKQ